MKKRKINKKAAIYTLDATLAILLTVVAVFAINNYLNKASYNKLLIGQPSHLASDVIRVLDKTGAINDFYLENEFFFNNTVMDRQGNNHGYYYGNAGLKTNYDDYYNFWLSLDGNESYVSIPYSNDFDYISRDDDFTISLRLKINNISNRNPLLEQYDDNQNFWLLYINNGGDIVFYSNQSFNYTDTKLRENEWTYIALTGNNSHFEFYINGEKDKTSPIFEIKNNNQNITIGRSQRIQNNDDDTFFDGDIDDITIFNSKLTDIEIKNLHQRKTITKTPLIEYNFNVKTETINDAINKYYQPQYKMLIRLMDINEITISNLEMPEISSKINFMASGDRITAIEKSNEIVNIIKIKYYSWTE
jgi:hypothetical protein